MRPRPELTVPAPGVHVLAFTDAVSIAIIGGLVSIIGALLTYAGILASRETKKQSIEVTSAVADVEQEIIEGRVEYESRGRIIDALQRDIAVLEARACRLEERADEADDRAGRAEQRELRCLEALELNETRFAVLEAKYGLRPDEDTNG